MSHRAIHAAMCAAIVSVLTIAAPPAEAGQRLDAIRQRGELNCGLPAGGVPGFNIPDAQGVWRGFNVDFCRAVAVAIFGSPDRVRFSPLTPVNRFTALQTGTVDILSSNVTATFSRDTRLKLDFAPVLFHDGQGFLVRRALNVQNGRQLNGASVCTSSGSTAELNLADFARANNITLNVVVIEGMDDTRNAFFAGRCDAWFWDRTSLGAQRLLAPNPGEFVMLPDVASSEPLAPAVLKGDDELSAIVRWTAYVLIIAEAKGVTSQNAEQQRDSQAPEVRRLLGTTAGIGADLGLDERWAFNVIRTIGNYGEMFERHLGARTPLGIARGRNIPAVLPNGLLYAPPLR